MKIKELFKGIEATNKIQEALESNSRASIQVYIDDIEVGHECHTLNELKQTLGIVYTDEFINAVLTANFKKTYNNTLSSTLEFDMLGYKYSQKVDLFVYMGGF